MFFNLSLTVVTTERHYNVHGRYQTKHNTSSSSSSSSSSLHFRRETIAYSRSFRAFYMNHGPRTITHSRLFRITNKILKVGTCHFTIIKRNITIIFREYFSSLRFDSDKIFRIIIFCRGPRTTYSVFNFQLRTYYYYYYYYYCACITKQ